MSRARAVCHGPFGRVALYELDRPILDHAHRDGHLIFLLRGAPGMVTVGTRQVLADAFNAVAVNAWEPHDFQPVSGTCGEFLVLYMDTEWFGRAGGLSRDTGLRFGSPEVPRGGRLARLVSECAALLEAPSARGVLRQTVLELGLACATPRTGAHPVDPWASLDARLHRALPLLAAPQATLGRIADACGLSRAHFHRLFREQVGAGPSMIRNTLRIERALERVTMTSRTIGDIADELGFSAQSVFSRFFAAHVGMAPTDYRRAAYVVA